MPKICILQTGIRIKVKVMDADPDGSHDFVEQLNYRFAAIPDSSAATARTHRITIRGRTRYGVLAEQ